MTNPDDAAGAAAWESKLVPPPPPGEGADDTEFVFLTEEEMKAAYPQDAPADAPAQSAESEEAQQEEPLPEFDARYRKPFEGLLWLGYLSKEFSLYGHRFLIETPTEVERLMLGEILAPYQGTLAQESAYVSATVAAYLVKVDGQDLPLPIMQDATKETVMRDRFRWVTENLRRDVSVRIYERCLELDHTVRKVLEAMGKA